MTGNVQNVKMHTYIIFFLVSHKSIVYVQAHRLSKVWLVSGSETSEY